MLKSTAYLFGLLGMVFIPVQVHLLPWDLNWPGILFSNLLLEIANDFLGIPVVNGNLASDSVLLYLLVALLLGFSCLLSISIIQWKRTFRFSAQGLALLRSLMAYYLAWQLFSYGMDKVLKGQFYLPEPNLLYTPLGQLDQDLLFWTSMGTSYFYNLFMGGCEIVAAIMLIFRKTRIAGALFSAGILLNVVMINMGFDISVKLYSAFLLFLSLVLLSPQFSRMFSFLFAGKKAALLPEPLLFKASSNRPWKRGLQIFFVGLMVLNALGATEFKVINDDLVDRPYLHGAYEVKQIQPEDANIRTRGPNVRRFFIHRNGYLIIQDEADRFTDYQLVISPVNFQLTDYRKRKLHLKYKYDPDNEKLALQYFFEGHSFWLHADALNWRSLPLLQEHFHWTVDQYP